jgi:hypothetical protein
MDANSIIQALRDRSRKFVSLDSPQDSDLGDMLIDIGAGFVPVVGTGTSARDFERARREDDKLGMALSGLGMIPVVGGVTSGINKLRKGGKAVEAAVDTAQAATPSLRETLDAAVKQSEDAPAALAGFGKKKAKEAARQKEIEKAIKEAEQRAAESAGQSVEAQVKKAGGQRKSGAIPADYYRQMEATQGPAAVLADAKSGAHIQRRADGSIIGAPRHITSGAGLGAMRRSLDTQFNEGVDALEFADPTRVGNWYDRAKGAQAASSEPYQLDRSLNAHAVYSAGVSPQSELAFALKHDNSRALGAPEMAYRGAPMRTLDNAVAADVAPRLAAKVGEYRVKNDPRVAVEGSFGVNDFRAAQGFGYTDAQGKPWKAGVSQQMHPFMDAETALMVDRANARGAGGRTDWTGPQLQEVPWVYGKAQDLYDRGKNASYKGGNEGIVRALRDANKTIADYMPNHTFSSTYEYVPGANTGHIPELLNESFAGKRAYGDIGRWDITNNDAALYGMPASVGAGSRDAIHYAMGLRQLPTSEGVGVYKNTAGVVENNPVTVSRALANFPTGNSATLNPNFRAAMEAGERFRAANDVQEAGAGHIMFTAGNRKGKDALLVEMPRQASAAEMGALQNALRGTNFQPSASARGVAIANFEDADKVKAAALRKLTGKKSPLNEALPAGATVTKAGMESVYTPLQYGEGKATEAVLRGFADLPEGVSQTVTKNLSESEDVRKILKQKIERDAQFPSARKDVQEMRKFFSEADWAKAVELMKKGMAPAAAVAALGYSLPSMAEENK